MRHVLIDDRDALHRLSPRCRCRGTGRAGSSAGSRPCRASSRRRRSRTAESGLHRARLACLPAATSGCRRAAAATPTAAQRVPADGIGRSIGYGAGVQRLPIVAPASTPGIVIGCGSPGRPANGESCSSGAGPRPSVSASARRSTSCTSDCSRKRTSAFVGCTLTSTRSGGISMKRCTSGTALLDGRDAVRLGNRVRDGAVPDDAAVDEDVLRAAHRTVVAERGHVAVNRNAPRLLAELQQIQALTEQLEEALGQAPLRADIRAAGGRPRSATSRPPGIRAPAAS